MSAENYPPSMQIKVVLFSVFREQLPREKHGRTTVELAEKGTIKDLLAKLEIKIAATCSVNGQIEYDQSRQLSDGDEVQIFRPVGGG
jgi:sulfur carrier protein ThiS